MAQNKSGFVLHVQIATELKRRMALRAVHEDRNGGENVADRKLATGEDRSRGQ